MEVEPGVLLWRSERVSSQLSPLPTHSTASINHPLLASGAAHYSQPHQGMPSSPGELMPPDSPSSPRTGLQKQNSCPSPSTSLPQVPWEEAREPPWLLIHPAAASPRSPHPTWGSRAPPYRRPHPGSEAAGCHRQHLHRASHSFPRTREEDFQGPKSKSIWGLEQLAHLLPKQPDSPSSPKAPRAKGESRAEAGTGSLPQPAPAL